MNTPLEVVKERFLQSLKEVEEALPIMRSSRRDLVISQADLLLRRPSGLDFLYRHIEQIIRSGIFDQTVWNDPHQLVPALVGGTLQSGYPTAVFEALSELRLVALAEGEMQSEKFSKSEAIEFLQDVLVQNFELVFEDFSAPFWQERPQGELRRIRGIFDLLRSKIHISDLKERFLQEIESQMAHRPIMTQKTVRMLEAVGKELELEPKFTVDTKLQELHQAYFAPTKTAAKTVDPEAYYAALKSFTREQLLTECKLLGGYMMKTGLVSVYHLKLIQFIERHHPEYIPRTLRLNSHGEVEYERHAGLIRLLIRDYLGPAMPQAVYGLSRVLRRNLFSRKPLHNAFQRLLGIKIHPEIARKLRLSTNQTAPVDPLQLLVSGTLCVLGQPLGVRQGNNPTCQSARGISMWSRNAPAKLINLIIDGASSNNLIVRYEGSMLESSQLGKGLVEQLDYQLDPVSIVLVPHLDKIYNEMMGRAGTLYPQSDPHISVNPAFYGHWIQTGFRSCYNPAMKAIQYYPAFIRIFYAAFHPVYNGGYHISYPVPMGIFITDSGGRMLGFHAISLLRISQFEDKEWRAYFFNPNSEGRQNWGQGIKPSVAGKGELFGESSLPVEQFAARIYAFHYNRLRIGDRFNAVPQDLVDQIQRLAKASWGRAYHWLD